MRELATADRIREFMRRLGKAVRTDTRIYLTGGATAVLMGWRETTIDVDIKIVPDRDEAFRALPELKEALHLNIELASPDQFIPPIPDWESRSPFICQEGRVQWHHYDLYSQALAKIERAHERDLLDVREMLRRGLIEPVQLKARFEQIRPNLYRYPAIDPDSFAQKVDRTPSGE
ncbi:MAG: hypothetical protein HYY16_05475 [Planctomycetes bacterium]|nr:hypothetical protein [Planctomycetota bacterium]